jgi:hypothetical protein
MEGLTKEALRVRGRLVDKGKEKFSSRNLKSRGKSKSPVQLTRRCWKCSKVGHCKRNCKSKLIENSPGANEKQ